MALPSRSTLQLSGNGFDRLLGPSATRYFGAGYRRTTYDVSPLEVDADDRSHATAVGRVTYASDWSLKSIGATLTPHLSTVDAVVLAVPLIEALLRADGISDVDLGLSWIEALTVRASARPLESLSSVPLLISQTTRTDSESHPKSTFECRIGPLLVDAVVRHTAHIRSARPAEGQGGGRGPLTELFRGMHHHSQVRKLDLERQTLRSAHRIEAPTAGISAVGLESAYWPAPSIIDCLVLAGQMAQVLVYARERVDRGSTNNLWMRRARFEAVRPTDRPRQSDATMEITGSTSASRGDQILNGVSVEVPDLFGIRVTASLAYYAPSSVPFG